MTAWSTTPAGRSGLMRSAAVAEPAGQDDLVVRRALGSGATGREYRSGEGGVAEGAEPVERGLLDDALGDPAAAHAGSDVNRCPG